MTAPQNAPEPGGIVLSSAQVRTLRRLLAEADTRARDADRAQRSLGTPDPSNDGLLSARAVRHALGL